MADIEAPIATPVTVPATPESPTVDTSVEAKPAEPAKPALVDAKWRPAAVEGVKYDDAVMAKSAEKFAETFRDGRETVLWIHSAVRASQMR